MGADDLAAARSRYPQGKECSGKFSDHPAGILPAKAFDVRRLRGQPTLQSYCRECERQRAADGMRANRGGGKKSKPRAKKAPAPKPPAPKPRRKKDDAPLQEITVDTETSLSEQLAFEFEKRGITLEALADDYLEPLQENADARTKLLAAEAIRKCFESASRFLEAKRGLMEQVKTDVEVQIGDQNVSEMNAAELWEWATLRNRELGAILAQLPQPTEIPRNPTHDDEEKASLPDSR